MYCVYCGKEIDDSSVYCVYCGKKTETLNREDSIISTMIDDDSHEKAQLDIQEKPQVNRKTKIALIVTTIVVVLVVSSILIIRNLSSGSNLSEKQEDIDSQYKEKYSAFVSDELSSEYGIAEVGDISYDNKYNYGVVSGTLYDVSKDDVPELIVLTSETTTDMSLRISLYTIEGDTVSFVGENPIEGELAEYEYQDENNEYSGDLKEYYLVENKGEYYVLETWSSISSGGSTYNSGFAMHSLTDEGVNELVSMSNGISQGTLYYVIDGSDMTADIDVVYNSFIDELAKYGLEDIANIYDSDGMYEYVSFEVNEDNNIRKLAKREREWFGENHSQVTDYTEMRSELL